MSEMKVDLTNVSDSELINECRKRFIMMFEINRDCMDWIREDDEDYDDEKEYDEKEDDILYKEFKEFIDNKYWNIEDRIYDDIYEWTKEKWNYFKNK